MLYDQDPNTTDRLVSDSHAAEDVDHEPHLQVMKHGADRLAGTITKR